MDANEVQRLASMASSLRPDWSMRSLRTFIERNLANRAYGDTAVAFAWICTHTKTETPRLILESGVWWKAAGVDGASSVRPPRREEACADCGRTQDQHRPGPDDEHEWRPAGTAARDRSNTAAALARAELAQTRANLCPCGVPKTACRGHHQPDEETSDE